MLIDVLGALAAFGAGTGVAALSYLFTKKMLGKNTAALSALSFARQLLNVFFIVALYVLAPYTPFDRWFLLIGGALGTTVPMFFFTARLLKEGKDGSQI